MNFRLVLFGFGSIIWVKFPVWLGKKKKLGVYSYCFIY
jgi:hypothetical protein